MMVKHITKKNVFKYLRCVQLKNGLGVLFSLAVVLEYFVQGAFSEGHTSNGRASDAFYQRK